MKKKIFSLILAVCLIVPAMFLLTACDNKKDISAPVIETVFQIPSGAVYVKVSGLTTEYSPQVSFDGGKTFYQTNFYQSTTSTKEYCQVINYTYQGQETSDGKFYYGASSQDVEVSALTTVNIQIRDGGSADYNPSPLSNSISIKLLKPQQNINNFDSLEVFYGSATEIQNSEPYIIENPQYGIGYNKNTGKYLFLERSYNTSYNANTTEWTYTETYNTVNLDNTYECYVIKQSDIPVSGNVYSITVGDMLDSYFRCDSFDYKPCSQLSLNDDDFFGVEDSIVSPDSIYAYVAIRKKANNTFNTSAISFIKVKKCTFSYNIVVNDPNSNNYFSLESYSSGISGPMVNNFIIHGNSEDTITKDYILSKIQLGRYSNYNKMYGYSNPNEHDIVSGIQVDVKLNGDDFTAISKTEDLGKLITISIKVNNVEKFNTTYTITSVI